MKKILLLTILVEIASAIVPHYNGAKILVSYNYPAYTIGVAGSAGAVYIKTGLPNGFRIVKGLNGHRNTISFQSTFHPRKYLRHRGFLGFVDTFQNSGIFRADASFYIRMNKYYQGYAAFESSNYPGRFLRHQDYRIKLHPEGRSALYKKDTSFRMALYESPYRRAKILRSYNYPAYTIGVTGTVGAVYIKTGFPDGFQMVKGLNGKLGTISFQSVSNQRKYLRHRGFLAYVDTYQNSGIFKDDASFYIRMNKYYQGYAAFESSNYPGRFLRHQGYRIKLHPGCRSALYKKDASFRIA